MFKCTTKLWLLALIHVVVLRILCMLYYYGYSASDQNDASRVRTTEELLSRLRLARNEVGMEDVSALRNDRFDAIQKLSPTTIKVILLIQASGSGNHESVISSFHTFRLGTPLEFELTCEIHLLMRSPREEVSSRILETLASNAPGCAVVSPGDAQWQESLALVPSNSEFFAVITNSAILLDMDTGNLIGTMRKHDIGVFVSPYELRKHSDDMAGYHLLRSVSNRFCADREIYNGGSHGLEHCQTLCTKDDSCRYYSSWKSTWCRLTRTCENLVIMEGHAITVYGKQTHPDWFTVSGKGRVCADEGQDCGCNGLVLYGRKYVFGDSGQTLSLEEIMELGFVWQHASGSIKCSDQGMGRDPTDGLRKHCYCVPQEHQPWKCHKYKLDQNDLWCKQAGTQGIYEYQFQPICGGNCKCCKRRAIPRQQHFSESVETTDVMAQRSCRFRPAEQAILSSAVFTKSSFRCWQEQLRNSSHSCSELLAIDDEHPFVPNPEVDLPPIRLDSLARSVPEQACLSMTSSLGLADDNYLQTASHRGGWKTIMRHVVAEGVLSLKPRQGQLLFVDCMESVFLWQSKRLDRPWIGILHYTPYLPPTFPEFMTLQGLLKAETFLASLPWCKMIIVLSNLNRDYIKEQLPDMKVVTIKHPIGMSDVLRRFDLEAFEANRRNWKIILLGQQYRKVSTLAFLQVRYPKLWMPGAGFTKTDYLERYRLEPDLPEEPDTSTFEIFHTDNFEEYDRMLMTNIIVLDLLDAAANNAVLEMINLAIPMLVTRHPAVEEYLGEDYPLFFSSVDDIEGIVESEENLLKQMELAHKYLVKLPKDDLQMDTFAASLDKAAQEVLMELKS